MRSRRSLDRLTSRIGPRSRRSPTRLNARNRIYLVDVHQNFGDYLVKLQWYDIPEIELGQHLDQVGIVVDRDTMLGRHRDYSISDMAASDSCDLRGRIFGRLVA